jgi:micrococcal nuclease
VLRPGAGLSCCGRALPIWLEMQRIQILVVAALAVAALALVAAHLSNAAAPAATGVVASVSDGNTLTLRDGQKVRLLQIDTPELGTGECYSRAARTALLSLAPIGKPVVLEADPALDQVDRYGRLLRYIERGGVNVNVELVRRGAAAPYFYGGDRGRYALNLEKAARHARAARRGLWAACPAAQLDPVHAVTTGQSGPASTPASPLLSPSASSGRCDSNYAGGCVPPAPPDLDCADIRALGIAPVRVIGSDPHRLDADGDGRGCE